MKLDLNVVRSILLAIEATPANTHPDDIRVEGIDEEVILEHLALLEEHGLIKAKFVRSGSAPGIYGAHVERMTWEGHEFLGNAKNDTVWKKATSLVASKGGAVSFEIFKALLVEGAKAYWLGPSASA